jgi:hypothetical protein
MSSLMSSLSTREQRLMVITIILVLSFAVAGALYTGYGHLHELDRRIANAEQEIVNLYEQTLQKRSVDAAFNNVVAEHSTGQTKAEIHDSLRREIYRLALKDPMVPAKEDYFISIPTLPEGVLREDGEGYKEYQIRFRVPRTTLVDALEFLKRLEQSNLLLRIDTFEMSRRHMYRDISLTIEVTRTVLSEVTTQPIEADETGWNAAFVNAETREERL